MGRLKWTVEKKSKLWRVKAEHEDGNEFTIIKDERGYLLCYFHNYVCYFKRLDSAKEVAQLLHDG